MVVQVSTLSNGVRVATDRVESVRTASIGVWIGTGARSEHPEENGVAHFLEHMAFKGTQRRSAQQLADEIEAVGGHMNAYTARESTAYYVKVMDRDTALGVDILGDITLNGVLADEEIGREAGVILQEIAQSRDTPEDVVYDHLQELAYPDQAMGRTILGPEDLVASMTRDRLTGFMARGYTGANMVVAASGNVEHAHLLELAEQAFADVPTTSEVSQESVPVYQGGHIYDQRGLEQLQIAFAWPGYGYNSNKHYAQTLLATIFGGGMSSRLFQELREKRGLAYSVYAYAAPYSDCGMFGVGAGTGEAQAGDLALLTCDMAAALGSSLTEEEIARAKAQLTASTVMAAESTSSRVEQLANQLLFFGQPISVDEQIAAIEKIDLAALSHLADEIFAGPMTLASVGPTGRLTAFDTLSARIAA